MEANHPHLATQRTFYVEISRARHHAELVTDDRDTLRGRLEAATGERVAALEAVEPEQAKTQEAMSEATHCLVRRDSVFGERSPTPEKTPELSPIEHDLGV